jgi:1-deoxy-D-xylulose-5-phosphate reductoisomerase
VIGVAVLGSTGSIGASTLDVIAQHPKEFRVVALSAHRNAAKLAQQVAQFRPEYTVISDPAAAGELEDRLGKAKVSTRVLAGREALSHVASLSEVQHVVAAIVGAAGLESTLAAARAGKRLLLANKESLVMAGPLLLAAVRDSGATLIPVDSEHSAIFQCLAGSRPSEVRRLIVTASGGPFREWAPEMIACATPADALRHPTWDMGAKITIDSATLANKALEVIEAHFLFGVPYERIEAVVHPQSIIHSMVEMVDGSVLAQMGFPTMELPVLYALAHPERLPYDCRRFDPVQAGTLTFEPVREERFPAFALGVRAGRAGGTMPAVFNAANEVAVADFMAGKIRFGAIARLVEATMNDWVRSGNLTPLSSADDAISVDHNARNKAASLLPQIALKAS